MARVMERGFEPNSWRDPRLAEYARHGAPKARLFATSVVLAAERARVPAATQSGLFPLAMRLLCGEGQGKQRFLFYLVRFAASRCGAGAAAAFYTEHGAVAGDALQAREHVE